MTFGLLSITNVQLFHGGAWVAVTAAQSRCSANNYWSFQLSASGKFVFVSQKPKLSCGKPADLTCTTCPPAAGGVIANCGANEEQTYTCPDGEIGYVSFSLSLSLSLSLSSL